MKNSIVIHIIRFFSLILLQLLVINQMEIHASFYLMVYPLFILLLPVDIKQFMMIVLAVICGFFVDFFSNTFGLHTSSLVLMAYLRKPLLAKLERRDGYEPNTEPGLNMGIRWFFYYSGLLLFIHHLWFFALEFLRWDMTLSIFFKAILSSSAAFLLILIMLLIFKKPEAPK